MLVEQSYGQSNPNPNPNPSSLGFLSGTVLETVRAKNYSFCSVIMNAPAAIMALKLEKGNKVQEKLVVSQSLGEKNSGLITHK